MTRHRPRRCCTARGPLAPWRQRFALQANPNSKRANQMRLLFPCFLFAQVVLLRCLNYSRRYRLIRATCSPLYYWYSTLDFGGQRSAYRQAPLPPTGDPTARPASHPAHSPGVGAKGRVHCYFRGTQQPFSTLPPFSITSHEGSSCLQKGVPVQKPRLPLRARSCTRL